MHAREHDALVHTPQGQVRAARQPCYAARGFRGALAL